MKPKTPACGLRAALAVLTAVAALSALSALTASATHAAEVPSFGFALNITLSPKAASLLQRTKEGITVSARYYGDPTAAARKHANEVGQIDLGGEELRLSARGGPAQITGQGVKRYRLHWTQGAPKVNVNAFSSRRSHADNLLSCDFIDGEVDAVVQAQPLELHCALITEGRASVLRPQGAR